MLIDLGALNRVVIDAQKGTAVVGGAALNADVLAATAGRPWLLPGGTCLGVGVGGLTLGGGIGYNTHWAGLTCDHLRSSRIVTAGGEVLEIDATTNSDLFWACRGGAGGNFGINTSIYLRPGEAPRTAVTFYRFDWRGADAAAAVLAAFDKLCRRRPPELNAVAMAQASRSAAGGPREAIDVMSHAASSSARSISCATSCAPSSSWHAPPDVGPGEVDSGTCSGSSPPRSTEVHSLGDISRYARQALPDSASARWSSCSPPARAGPRTTNGSFWSLGWVGGRRGQLVGRHRDRLRAPGRCRTLLRATPVWAEDAPAFVSATSSSPGPTSDRADRPHTPNESYQNFPNRGSTTGRRPYYARELRAPVDVKTKYDPDNVFRNPQSIPPRKRLKPR